MRFGLFSLFIVVSQSAYAFYDSDIERGLFTQKYKSPAGLTEECVVSKRFPEWPMSNKKINSAIKKEAALCDFDFYAPIAQAGLRTAGVCPKLNSTNPGVLIYNTNKHSKMHIEQNLCRQRHVDSQLLAKFKQSVSCSYTPSILAYYHFSQMFDTLSVPEATIRTMDADEHKKIRKQALDSLSLLGQMSAMIYSTWNKSWGQVYNNPQSQYANRVFTADKKQIYGALSENPRGELRYREIYGSWRDYEKRFDSLVAQAPYQKIVDSRPLEHIIDRSISQSSLQTLVQMKDVSDMLILDYILGQQDRPGNIHYQNKIYYSDNGQSWKSVKSKKTDEIVAKYKFPIKEMILKDNDCGIIKGNATKQKELLKNLSHISPKTYHKVMLLAERWTADPERTRDFLRTEWLFTARDVDTVTQDLVALRDQLLTRCRSGHLRLDLDTKSFYGSDARNISCEINTI